MPGLRDRGITLGTNLLDEPLQGKRGQRSQDGPKRSKHISYAVISGIILSWYLYHVNLDTLNSDQHNLTGEGQAQ